MLATVLLIAPLIGIASALLTMVLTPTLQHYFWTRQRCTERQFAAIEEVSTLASEVQVWLRAFTDMDGERRARLFAALVRAWVNVRVLFPSQVVDEVRPLIEVLDEALNLPVSNDCTPRDQLATRLFEAHQDAIDVLYWDMDIPPHSPWWRLVFSKRLPKPREPEATTEDVSIQQP